MKDKEQLLTEVKKLRTRVAELEKRETARKKAEEELKAANQQLDASNQQLRASEQQLKAANQQLRASEQQLKAANQQLRASERDLRKSKETAERYLNVAAEIIISLDTDGKITLLNDSGHRLLGYKNGELIGKNWFTTCIPEKVRKEIREVFKKLIKGEVENVAFYENSVVTRSGEEKTILWHNTLLTDDDGRVIGTLSSGENITERKQAEEALCVERDNLKNIFEAIEDGIYIVNQQYDIQYVNPVLIKDFGPYEDRKCYAYFHDRDDVCPWCKNIDVFAGKTVRWEWYSFKNQRTYDLIDTPLKNSDGSISKLEIFRDITARKQMEEQLKKSLKEKEILIKEIYHRVKNNLAVVSGLLNIQAADIKDKKAKAAFQETRDRIFSLAAVHSQLYHSENYSNVDYKKYIKKLVSNIFYSSQMSGHVKLHLDLDDITLPIDKAIPCGLLLNEVVTNALKHAFPGKRKGNLRIISHSLEDKSIEIIVKDDGIGLPESFNIEKTETFGLKLIDLMTKQIEGTLEIKSKKGTEFRIRLSTEPGQVIR